MFFRLQPYKSPGVLNSFQNWTDSADPDGMAVVIRLKNQLDRILDRATDEKGMVDYLSVAEDPTYWNFEEAASELQAIDSVAGMDNRTKIAFGINLYNMMIKHAHIKFGIPSKFFQRSIFFSGVSYNIGGDVLGIAFNFVVWTSALILIETGLSKKFKELIINCNSPRMPAPKKL